MPQASWRHLEYVTWVCYMEAGQQAIPHTSMAWSAGCAHVVKPRAGHAELWSLQQVKLLTADFELIRCHIQDAHAS